jgi:hypothetical protein
MLHKVAARVTRHNLVNSSQLQVRIISTPLTTHPTTPPLIDFINYLHQTAVGDLVEEDEVIGEIETDKVEKTIQITFFYKNHKFKLKYFNNSKIRIAALWQAS